MAHTFFAKSVKSHLHILATLDAPGVLSMGTLTMQNHLIDLIHHVEQLKTL